MGSYYVVRTYPGGIITKRHHGDGLYKRASEVLGIEYNELARMKRVSELYEFRERFLNLTWAHHKDAASIKQTTEIWNAHEYLDGRGYNRGKENVKNFTFSLYCNRLVDAGLTEQKAGEFYKVTEEQRGDKPHELKDSLPEVTKLSPKQTIEAETGKSLGSFFPCMVGRFLGPNSYLAAFLFHGHDNSIVKRLSLKGCPCLKSLKGFFRNISNRH